MVAADRGGWGSAGFLLPSLLIKSEISAPGMATLIFRVDPLSSASPLGMNALSQTPPVLGPDIC